MRTKTSLCFCLKWETIIFQLYPLVLVSSTRGHILSAFTLVSNILPRHLLRNLQRVIDDDEHLAKASPTCPLLAFKQPPNLKQTIVRSKLPSLQNSDHNTAFFARRAGSSTRKPPSHVRTPPTRYREHTRVARPTLSTSYIAEKDVPRHGTSVIPCRHYDNG